MSNQCVISIFVIDNDDYAEHDVSEKVEYKQADDDIVEDAHDNVHSEDIKGASGDFISLVDCIRALVDLFSKHSYLRVLASYFEDQ